MRWIQQFFIQPLGIPRYSVSAAKAGWWEIAGCTMVRSKIFENIRILRNSIIHDSCRFVSCNRSTMVYDKCRIMPLNVAFCNFMTDLYIRKPQGYSVKEPPCGFHFIYALLTALYRPVSYLLRYSRYRNVAICARVQVELGSKRPPPTPVVMPFSTAQDTAFA